MAKRSELEQQIAALQKELDAAGDDNTEVWVDDGKYKTKLTGNQATAWLGQLFGTGEPETGSGDAGKGTPPPPDPDPEKDGKPPAGHRYFR